MAQRLEFTYNPSCLKCAGKIKSFEVIWEINTGHDCIVRVVDNGGTWATRVEMLGSMNQHVGSRENDKATTDKIHLTPVHLLGGHHGHIKWLLSFLSSPWSTLEIMAKKNAWTCLYTHQDSRLTQRHQEGKRKKKGNEQMFRTTWRWLTLMVKERSKLKENANGNIIFSALDRSDLHFLPGVFVSKFRENIRFVTSFC